MRLEAWKGVRPARLPPSTPVISSPCSNNSNSSFSYNNSSYNNNNNNRNSSVCSSRICMIGPQMSVFKHPCSHTIQSLVFPHLFPILTCSMPAWSETLPLLTPTT